MSTILFITDLSDESRKALNYVFHFADRIRAKIIFLNCLNSADKKRSADSLQENTQKIYALRMLAAEFAFEHNCQIVTDYFIEEEQLESCFPAIEKKVKPDFCLVGIDYSKKSQIENENLVFKFIPRIISTIILIPTHIEFTKWKGISFIDQHKYDDSLRLKQVLLLSHLFNSKLFYFETNLPEMQPLKSSQDLKTKLLHDAIKNEKIILLENTNMLEKLEELNEQNEIQIISISNSSIYFEKVIEFYMKNKKGIPNLPLLIYQDKL